MQKEVYPMGEAITYDRKLFAEGALTAARFVVDQKPGFYHMDDLLG